MTQMKCKSSDSAAFQRFKEALKDRITLAHRDHAKRLSFYVDSSDVSWAGFITQVSLQDVK